jgi:hypothetical protein
MYTLKLKKHWWEQNLQAFESWISRIVHDERFWVVIAIVAVAVLVGGTIWLAQWSQAEMNGTPLRLYPYPF